MVYDIYYVLGKPNTHKLRDSKLRVLNEEKGELYSAKLQG